MIIFTSFSASTLKASEEAKVSALTPSPEKMVIVTVNQRRFIVKEKDYQKYSKRKSKESLRDFAQRLEKNLAKIDFNPNQLCLNDAEKKKHLPDFSDLLKNEKIRHRLQDAFHGSLNAINQAICVFNRKKGSTFDTGSYPAKATIDPNACKIFIENISTRIGDYSNPLEDKKHGKKRLVVLDRCSGTIDLGVSANPEGARVSNRPNSNSKPSGIFIVGNRHTGDGGKLWYPGAKLYGTQMRNDKTTARGVVAHIAKKPFNAKKDHPKEGERGKAYHYCRIEKDGTEVCDDFAHGCTAMTEEFLNNHYKTYANKPADAPVVGPMQFNYSNAERDYGEEYCKNDEYLGFLKHKEAKI